MSNRLAEPSRITRALPYTVAGAAAGYLYYLAANFEFQARPGTLGPDFWPKLILALAIAVCAWQIVAILVFDVRAEMDDLLAEYEVDTTDMAPESHPGLLLAGMGTTLAYVALVPILGFFLCTALYLAAFMTIGLYRRWAVLAAVSVIGTLILMFIFMKLVYVSLPIGTPPFDEITLTLMRVMGIR